VYRCPVGFLLLDADPPGGLVAIHFRHLAIHEDHAVGDVEEGVEGLLAVGHHVGAIVELGEHLQCDLLVDGVVLGWEQTECRAGWQRFGLGRAAGGRTCGRRGRLSQMSFDGGSQRGEGVAALLAASFDDRQHGLNKATARGVLGPKRESPPNVERDTGALGSPCSIGASPSAGVAVSPLRTWAKLHPPWQLGICVLPISRSLCHP